MGKPRIPTRIFKPAIFRGLPLADMKKLEQLPKEEMLAKQGCLCKRMEEAQPVHDWASSEAIYRNENNAWIILGRDRVTSKDTGYGGNCRPQAASIDIVAGKKGYDVHNWHGKLTDPDPQLDAARIYLSQKTDVDDNFSLSRGNVGYSRNRSAVMIKADAVRLHGREGIKLVTGCAFKNERNSGDGDIVSFTGIDIIAGNKDSLLEPMVKGFLLTECLQELGSIVRDIASCQHHNSLMWFQLWSYLGAHTHPYLFGVVAPDPILIGAMAYGMKTNILSILMPSVISMANLTTWEINYTRPYGGRYINSKWNAVN